MRVQDVGFKRWGPEESDDNEGEGQVANDVIARVDIHAQTLQFRGFMVQHLGLERW